MSVSRPTRVEIDLAALRHNFQEVQRTVGTGCEVLSVVKANAYGHGVGHVAPALAAAGASQFGVALVDLLVKLTVLDLKHTTHAYAYTHTRAHTLAQRHARRLLVDSLTLSSPVPGGVLVAVFVIVVAVPW